MSFKHLVTSGCSFTDNFDMRWPHYLAELLDAKLYNRGQGSCGNDWISKSAIYQTQLLLDDGIDPKDMLVCVMWSGIDRKSLFVSAAETLGFHNLISKSTAPNPINFIGTDPNQNCSNSMLDGYLVGAMNCYFENENIIKFKQECISKFFNDEALAIESYENFLRLQWYCESKGITLVNQTFMDIMHYPKYGVNVSLTSEFYRNIRPLYNMLNFDNWVFWNNTQGLFEYTKDNNLEFYSDNLHPRPESHKYYVENYLLDKIKELK